MSSALLVAPRRMPNIGPPPREPAAPQRSASFVQVLGAVFASFLGIRKKASGERDMVTIKPHHVIVAGVLCAAVFVLVLIVLVRYITRHA
ncbi:MAG: DUF2970 domain-containing protein [Betaproteobacteria bacterium]